MMSFLPGIPFRGCRRSVHLCRRAYNVNSATKRPPLAFAFDIDGVLIHGSTPIPAAKKALEILNGKNKFGLPIPYILITNGGGVGEVERCRRLSKQLGVPISADQYVQAHTILRNLASKYASKPVLVLGGKLDTVRKVAEDYGFKKAYTTLDVLAWNASVWPLHQLSNDERASTIPVDFSKTPISAVFVFHDPRNWALDIQVLLDVIQSAGVVGGPYVARNTDPEHKTEVFFCNPDLLWRSDFERPRLGQGAFKKAFQAVYKALNGSAYPYVQYGKPTAATYRFAEEILTQHLQKIYGPSKTLPSVYMVGDNPESDIVGANAAQWPSVLVHTGVYDPQSGPPSHSPTTQARDVEEAVTWAIDEEFRRVRNNASGDLHGVDER